MQQQMCENEMIIHNLFADLWKLQKQFGVKKLSETEWGDLIAQAGQLRDKYLSINEDIGLLYWDLFNGIQKFYARKEEWDESYSEMVALGMKGKSLEQIQEAVKIRKKVIDSAKEVYDLVIKSPTFNPKIKEHVHMASIYKSWIVLAEKEEEASFFVNNFSNIPEEGSLQERVRAIQIAISLNISPTSEWKWK